jgi:DNA-binding NarL/FixJ family response regulator
VTSGAEHRELATLRAYIRLGSIKAAADELRVSESTARQRLMRYYARHGFENAVQAAYHLDRVDGGHSTAR